MAETTDQSSSDVIDAIRPDLEAFASLWSALRTNYQGTNITKTVARLLHMYQPEEGVVAYERLLRTLCVLLEDFDGDGLRLLVSMVPPPKGVPDETIKDVFHKATGFVRLNAPIFHRNNASTLENENEFSSDGKIGGESSDPRALTVDPDAPRARNFRNAAGNTHGASTILRAVVKTDTPQKNENSSQIARDSEVFRGFPTNEITTTQSHARSYYGPAANYGGYAATQRYVEYRHGQKAGSSSNQPRGIDASVVSSAYRLKWFETPMLVRKSNYDGSPACPDLILKTSDNKFIRLPITKVNGPPIGNYSSSYNPLQPPYQTYHQNNPAHVRNDAFIESSHARNYSTFFPSHSRAKNPLADGERTNESTARKVVGSKVNLIDHDYEFTKFDEDSADKENGANENSTSPSSVAIEKFRDFVKIRQRAIQEDIYRMDVVRSEHEIVDSSISELQTIDVESLSIAEELRKGVEHFLKRAEEGKSFEVLPFPRTRALEQSSDRSPALLKPSSRMWKLERLAEYPRSWKKSTDIRESFVDDRVSASILSASSASRCFHGEEGRNRMTTKSERNSREISSPAAISLDGGLSLATEETNVGASSREATCAEPEPRNIDAFRQANSMSEFVNYRKQYYDTLLSIQRAKVAVANSLAISSSQTSSSYDPRVLQYLQQQHRMLHQQQQQMLIGSQHSMARSPLAQTGFNDARSAAGLWIRPSDWKYPSCGRYAFPRQALSVPSPSCNAQVPMSMPEDPSMTVDSRRSARLLSRTSERLPVKRRKLEEIVGKLKETDDN